jgi:pimeloyl-ACP methyl ester carboxylesterase
MEVPLRHSEKSKDFYRDGTIPGIGIALIRLPALDQANTIGSLFLNPGGFGASGVDYLLLGGGTVFSRQVRKRFDFVGFDRRGTHSSNSLSCSIPAELLDALDDLAVYPRSRSELFARIRVDSRLARACKRNAGPIIDHMSTADVARDLDILREAVGDEQLYYAGYSYGSFLGVTYASLFPENVGALIVDAVPDPVALATGTRSDRHFPASWRLRSDVGALETLGEFFRLCDLAGQGRCAFSGDASSRFAALLERLAAAPIRVPRSGADDLAVDDAWLIVTSFDALYNSFWWPALAQTMSALERHFTSQGSDGGLGPLVEAALRDDGGSALLSSIEEASGILCSDSDNPRNPFVWPLAAEIAERRYGYFGPLSTWVSSACARWPGSNKSRYAGPFDRWTANPVLLMNTRFDPANRHEGARATAERLPNSHLLTVEGWGHTTSFLSLCAKQIVSAYLIHGALPDEDSTCQQDVPPFGLTPGEAFPDGIESTGAE